MIDKEEAIKILNNYVAELEDDKKTNEQIVTL